MKLKDIYKSLYSDQKVFNTDFEINHEAFKEIINNIDSLSTNKKFIKNLYDFNKKINTCTKTKENIRLIGKGFPCIVTGHQPCFLTGPLYTIYKAISVIKYSDILSEKLELNVIPVFWIAGHDHDLFEVNRLKYVHNNKEIKTVKMDLPFEKQPVGKINIGKKGFEAIDEIFSSLGNTEYKKELKEVLYSKTINSFTQSFGSIMAMLFKNTGLVFYDYYETGTPENARGFFDKTLEYWEDIVQNINIKGQNLKKHGFDPLLSYENTKSVPLLFIEENNKREQIKKVGANTFITEKNIYTKDQLLDLAEKLTPNVATRPLFQDYIFRTISYVGGPGELLYLYQLKNIYGIYNMKNPFILPRISATIIEGWLKNYIDKEGFDISKIEKDKDNYLNKIIEKPEAKEAKNKINYIKNSIINEYECLYEILKGIDKQLLPIAKKNLKLLNNQINFLEGRIDKSLKEQNKIKIDRFEKVAKNLYPDDKPQERVLNIVYYLNKYGFDFLDDLFMNCRLTYEHQYIYLERRN